MMLPDLKTFGTWRW